MNTFVLSPPEENMAQCSAAKHEEWRVYITVLVPNHGIIKSINILTAVIRPMIRFDIDIPRDCLRQKVKWTQAIH
jgi:hypothetical protein